MKMISVYFVEIDVFFFQFRLLVWMTSYKTRKRVSQFFSWFGSIDRVCPLSKLFRAVLIFQNLEKSNKTTGKNDEIKCVCTKHTATNRCVISVSFLLVFPVSVYVTSLICHSLREIWIQAKKTTALIANNIHWFSLNFLPLMGSMFNINDIFLLWFLHTAPACLADAFDLVVCIWD